MLGTSEVGTLLLIGSVIVFIGLVIVIRQEWKK
jgi:uncharacterized membrane protein